MNPMSETINELYRWYEVLNEHYFEAKLPAPMITVQKTRAGNLGHFTLSRVWKPQVEEGDVPDENSCFYEINLAAQALDRTPVELAVTVQHELIHFFNHMNGVKDCSGKIHNKKFKQACEAHDLEVSKDKKVGWGITNATPKFTQFVNDILKPDMSKIHYFREEPAKEPKEKQLHPVYHVFCESCGKKFDYKPKKKDKDNFDFMNDFGFVCKACGTEMQIEEDEA